MALARQGARRGGIQVSKIGCLVVAMIVATGLLPVTAAANDERAPSHASRRALVGPRQGEKDRAEQAIRARGGRVIDYYKPGDYFVVETPGNAPDFVRDIRRKESVRHAELDYEITLSDTTPNDTSWSSLWGLRKVGMPKAWDTATGSKEIIVGVIDTGVDLNHEDLAGNLWVNQGEIPGNGIDDDGNSYVDDVHGRDCREYWPFVPASPMDDNGHGTHVAGTIGAVGNNGKGVAGANWSVSIMALKALDADGRGHVDDAIRCIDYAIAEGAHLTSNSYGGYFHSNFMCEAIERAQRANQLFVAAAGNHGLDNDEVELMPASCPSDNVVSVAATNSFDGLASFSNYGAEKVDLGAPGVNIHSTWLGNTYFSASGTSMAAPHVAGAAALLLSTSPGLDYTRLRDWIFLNIDPLPSLQGKVATNGRLNVARAIASAPPSALAVTELRASPGTFSPNGDGTSDDTAISFRLTRPARWAVSVADRMFTGTNAAAGYVVVRWDGTNGLGLAVSDGTYDVDVTAIGGGSGSEAVAASTTVTVDTTGPQISNVATENVASGSVDIVWTTDEASDSRVEFGTAPGQYTKSVSDPAMVTGHRLTLSGLSPSTTYYYRVSSADAGGNRSTSAEQTLTTLEGQPGLQVRVYKSSSSKQGKFFVVDIGVSVTDPGGVAVEGAAVKVDVGSGECPIATVLSTLSGKTNEWGYAGLAFKTRDAGRYCAAATVTATGYASGSAATSFDAPY